MNSSNTLRFQVNHIAVKLTKGLGAKGTVRAKTKDVLSA